jgi:hypothetical protein
MTSPGVKSLAGGVTHLPSRLTRALIANRAFSASMALPASRSSQKPIVALATNSTKIMKKSGQWRTTAERTTATSIIQGIGPQKYPRNFSSALVFFYAISLGPYCTSRLFASASVKPSGDEPRRFSTSAIGNFCRSSCETGLASGEAAGRLGLAICVAMKGILLHCFGDS